MGRLLSRRYLVTGVLKAETPVHIGAAFADLDVDMPLARDGRGRFYIPGTSLAGPIRRWWDRRGYDIDTVFGRIVEEKELEEESRTLGGPDEEQAANARESAEERKKNEGHASYVVVDDAPAREGTDAVPELRDGVGIDRYSGVAADAIKYDREVLPCGTLFDFRMEIEVPDGEVSAPVRGGAPDGKLNFPNDITPQLGALIDALEHGRIRFGAAKTRGLGRLLLRCTTVAADDIGGRDGLLERLRQPNEIPQNLREELLKNADNCATSFDEIAIEIHWRPELPVMNKSSAEGVSVDALPLVTAFGDRLQPVITGASLKGTLRAHSERICRTLAGDLPSDPENPRGDGDEPRSPRQEFLDVIQSDSCELVVAIFGFAPRSASEDKLYKEDDEDEKGKKKDGAQKDTKPPIPGLGALSVDDCLIDRPISRKSWEDLLTKSHDKDKEEKTGVIRCLLDGDNDCKDRAWNDFRAATHVAIDRWTGGAADSLLFSRIEPSIGSPEDAPQTFNLWLDPERIARSKPKPVPVDDSTFRHAAVALLIVTLRDLARQRISIGFGVTRGLGSVKVDKIVIGGLTPVSADALGLPLKTGDCIEIKPGDFETDAGMRDFEPLQKAWSEYWEDQYWDKHGKTQAGRAAQ